MMTPAPTYRRFLRFRLRTLLAAMLVANVLLGWLGRHYAEYRSEQRTLAAIQIDQKVRQQSSPLPNAPFIFL